MAHFSARCELSDHWVRTRESGVQLQGDRDISLPSGLTQWRTQPDGQDGQSFKRRPEAQLLPPQVASAYCRVFEKPDWIAECPTRRFPRTTLKGKRHLRTKRTRHQPRRGRHCPQSSDPEPTGRRPTSRQLALTPQTACPCADNMALFKITVLCALLQAAAAVRRQPPASSFAPRAPGLHHLYPSARSLLRASLHQSSDACTAAVTDPHPLFTAQLECSGHRSITNQTTVSASPVGHGIQTVKFGSTPYGTYSASDIFPKIGGEVTYIDVTFPERFVTDPADFNGNQEYNLIVKGCMIVFGSPPTCVPFPGVDEPVNDGHFVHESGFAGSQFIPKRKGLIDMALKIHWCPDQNYFVVKFFDELLTTPLVYHPRVYATVAAQ